MQLKIQSLENGCWQGRLGPIRLGCCLRQTLIGERVQRVRSLRQVHGGTIVTDADYTGEHHRADGLISRLAAVGLMVRSADCVPVHLSDGYKIGIVHSGWRGTRAGIVAKLAANFETRRSYAVIGPAISQKHYEVDADLYESWLAEEPALAPCLRQHIPGSSKRLLDLKGWIKRQLLGAGVPQEQITTIPVCTYASDLPSYRREGAAAQRIFSYIYRLDA